MKNTMRRVLCTVLVAVMLVTGMPLAYSSATTSISIGDKITLGTYNGEPITWVCVDIDDNGPLMLSEDVLCVKEYDAPGASSTYHTDGWGYIREKYGSNCWYDSNIRQWLNSNESAVSWTHCPPSYSSEAGFMTNFSPEDLNCIKTVNHLVNVNSWENKRYGYCDGGSSDTIPDLYEKNFNVKNYYYKNVEDKMFLLSASQFNRIYISNKEFLNASRDYLTCIIDGNNSASFENVCPIDINTLQVVSYAFRAYEKTGIRPAFYLDVDAIEKENKYFPDGYDFTKDKYPFTNQTHSISFKRFTDFFGPLWASIIYALHSETGEKGECFGMATTTAALLKNYTSLSDITHKDEYGNKLNPNCINDIWNGTLGHQNFYIDSLNMTVSDYIDYGFLYQWGPWESWIESSGDPWDSIITLYNDVYDFVYNGGEPVVVNIGSGFSGHAVLAIGLKENSKYGKYNCTEIIIDDSNHLEERSIYLLKNDEGEYFNWVFEFDNSEIWTGSTYSLATRKPASMFTYAVERISNNLTYTLYEDHRLLLVEKEISLDTLENLIKTGTIWSPSLYYLNNESQESETITEQNEKLYWLDASYNEPLTFSTDETSASFTYSDYNTALSVDLPYETDCAISTTADDYINLETNNIEGKTIGINKTEFNENNEKYVLEINGLASSEITATQTDSGLLVTGISDGTVTLTKNDEVIETQEIKDAVGEIEITYDKTGEDEDVELDYHSHSYSSSITTPATHTAEGVETFTCDCGDSYTKPVAKLEGHTHTVTNTVAPTCTKNGLTVYTCACGDSYSETVKAKGHSYGDDGICVNCDDYNKAYDKTANDSENCSHLCHKGGFMGFIWKIVQIFIRLFKTNPVCECGAAHY